ncbi:MAG: VOC family protein [Spirochaetota bacterium]
MRINTGIITQCIDESRIFYRDRLRFREKFVSEWFVLLCSEENPQNELALMLPGMPQVRLAGFQKPYTGQGIWLIMECEDVEAEYHRLQSSGLTIELPLTAEEWGDYHFVIKDPNGILIDFVQHREVDNEA